MFSARQPGDCANEDHATDARYHHRIVATILETRCPPIAQAGRPHQIAALTRAAACFFLSSFGSATRPRPMHPFAALTRAAACFFLSSFGSATRPRPMHQTAALTRAATCIFLSFGSATNPLERGPHVRDARCHRRSAATILETWCPPVARTGKPRRPAALTRAATAIILFSTNTAHQTVRDSGLLSRQARSQVVRSR